MSYVGNPDSAATGFCPAPPPPPPPQPVPGQTPALRIDTAEAPRPRRPQNNNDPYEPPAAIQNAMMTKDKKPFTYTPGMGGKLDLSQIRSPRMARRVAKNANDEGIEGPPKSAHEPKPTSSLAAPNLYVQPQVAVPVFPLNMPTAPSANRTHSVHVNRAPSTAGNSQPADTVRVGGVRNEGKATPVMTPASPQSPTTPPLVTLAKAPTPWLQNKPKQQDDLPEWAKKSNNNKPIDVGAEVTASVTPGIYHQPQPSYTHNQPPPTPPIHVAAAPQTRQQDRVIPVRIEERPSVFTVKNETAGHHQFKQAPNQQQRWGQPQPQQQSQQYQNHPQPQPQQQSGGARIIPIMLEDNGHSQARTIPVDVQGSKVVIQRGPAGPAYQPEPGPVQSRSFRVLQKITDTDSDNDVDGNSEQIRKLQLTEDDKALMNKFKEQVDGENYLHQEEDPRYRGAAIPSRAFRFLQNMTDSGEVSTTSNAQRPTTAINKKQNRNSKSFEEAQANLPPSEQQVQEPRKYMGGAIPSRSFRMLQAMTSPDNIAPQENRQQDFTSRTENNVTGNQQSGVYFPNCPSPYWSPEGGWWGYYPLGYAPPPPNSQPLGVAHNPYAYCDYADGNPYAYYTMYDQNYHHQNYALSYPQQVEGQGEVPTNGEYSQDRYPDGQQRVEPTYAIHDYSHTPPTYSVPAQNSLRRTHEGSRNPQEEQNVAPDMGNEGNDKAKVDNVHISTPKTNYLTVPKCVKKNRPRVNEVRNSNEPSVNGELNGEITLENRKNKVHEMTRGTTGREDSSVCTIGSDTDRDSDSDTDSDSDSDSSDSDSESDKSESESTDDSPGSSSSNSDSESGSEYIAYTNDPKVAVLSTRPEEPTGTPICIHSVDKECLNSLSTATTSEDGCEHSSRLSSDKLSCSECDSDADDEYQIESLNNDCILPHQLSVIYEDAEQTETESDSRKLEYLKGKEIKESLESSGESPDDGDDTTVSVSLPLRFKFSVSENNEDVTTVIVGDSTVRSTKKLNSEEEVSKPCCEPDSSNDVHVNFRIRKNNNTSVDFTLKKQKGSLEESFDTEFTLTNDDAKESRLKNADSRLSLGEMNGGTDENANLKIGVVEEVPDVESSDRDRKIEAELTIHTKRTDVIRHVWKKELDLETETDLETTVNNEEARKDTETAYSVRNDTTNSNDSGYDAEYDVTTSKSAVEGDLHKEVVEQESLKIKELDSVRTEFAIKKTKRVDDSQKDENRTVNEIVRELNGEKNDASDYTVVGNGNAAKRLLSVQNLRDETDDEDSGVTSDMSRMISEVDTDSECASIKRMNKYQRTQTHSRLFKLLNDDAILAEEDSADEHYSAGRREHLSLPLLKANVFSYDENCHSNYSSGITSPDYSPLCEHSWRRIHEGRSFESENSSSVTTPNECADLGEALGYGIFAHTEKPAPNDDPYFQTWKTVTSPVQFDYDILPSIAFKKLKKLENGITGHSKGRRTHVLCPRIKSSKNVPQALQSPHKAIASSIPFMSTKSSLKNGHC